MNKMIVGSAIAATMSATMAMAASWDMPTPYPEAEFHTKNVQMFVEDVAKATNGSLTIKVHSGQSLFKHPEIKRAVQTNQVPIGEMLMANLQNDDAIFGVDAVPFLATNYADAKKLWDAQRDLVQESLSKQGLQLLYAVPWPGQGFYTKKPINSLNDLQGVKFRTYNAATANMAELMGAVPTIVEAVEIPQAFSTGVVDAMVTSGATGQRTKAWDFSTHFYDLNAWMPKNMIFVNKRAFAKLSSSEQKALLDAAAKAETRGWQMSEDIASASTKALGAAGMTVEAGSETLVNGLKGIGETLTKQWLKNAGDRGETIMKAYQN